MITPPALPPQADPTSEEARLLGPFSLRRTKNIHRRFIREELGRTLPPLHFTTSSGQAGDTKPTVSNSRGAVVGAGIAPVGFEGTRLIEELEYLTTPPPKPLPRRTSRRALAFDSSASTQLDEHTELPRASELQTETLQQPARIHQPRFIRRRFAEILAQTPVLTYVEGQSPRKKKPSDLSSGAYQGRWIPSLSPAALLKSRSRSSLAGATVSHADQGWITKALAIKKASGSAKR